MIEENEKWDVKSNMVSSVTEEDQTFTRYSFGNQESESDERKVLGFSWAARMLNLNSVLRI